jgi:hypothetical protein
VTISAIAKPQTEADVLKDGGSANLSYSENTYHARGALRMIGNDKK